VRGVRDYVNKNGFPGALIGLSGGVDSALTLAIAVDALGAERVRAVMMPSQFTLPMSIEDASQLAEALGVRHDVLPVKPAFDAFLSTLSAEFRGLPWDTTEENLQARIRGTLLMALSNKYGSIVLTTGNKSRPRSATRPLRRSGRRVRRDQGHPEDSSTGCALSQRALAVIPNASYGRPVRTRAGQTDQDSLPGYDVLDTIITGYMQEGQSIADLVRAGLDEAVVRKVVRMIRTSEYKRRQSPVGIRVTHRGFGRDWRYPITNRFREESAAL
jgi:NAD+ synthase (glutamine-hydrolysing)